MPDTTNEDLIASLLNYLDGRLSTDHRWTDAIRGLVAERDELKQRHAHLSQSYTMLAKECDALKQRVAELESHKSVSVRLLIEERDALRNRVAELETLSKPAFFAHGQRLESIDLRERLVCAIWPVLIQQWREYKDAIDPRGDARSDALIEADKMLAAMRRGDTNGK